MTLSEATRLYQAALEEQRGDPFDEGLELEVKRSYREMERLWDELLLKEILA